MNRKLMTVGLAISLIVGASLARAELRTGYGPAGGIARAADLPGKNVTGQCLPFARTLQARLQAAGIPARIITYAYQPGVALAGQPPGASLSHAVVAYEDGGRTYIMDNQSWSPMWIRDVSASEMAQRFSGPGVAVLGAKVSAPAEPPLIAASAKRHSIAARSGAHRQRLFISPKGNRYVL